MQWRNGVRILAVTAFLTVQTASAAGPSLTWSQMGSDYSSGSDNNWGFVPSEFNGSLFAPMGDYGACVVKRWTGSSWVDDFLDNNWGTGRDFENLTFLTVYNNKLYMTCETDSSSAYNHGVMVRDTAGNWSVSLPYTQTAEGAMQFGSFGMAVFNGKLYTGVVPYAANTTLTIYEHNGSTWTGIKNYKTSEQLRAWSLGSDGTNLYVGIGTRGRNNAATLGIERYDGSTWASELAGKAMHSMACFKGSMYAGGNGRIYKRNSSGVWSEVFNTGQAFVIGMTIIDYGDGMEILYAGTENRPRLYATSDGAAWDMMHEFNTTSAGCYVGQFQNTPVASVTYFEGSAPKVVKVWRGSPQDAAPIIAEVSPDPDTALGGSPYARQLSLVQGNPPPTWSVISGPAGLQVNSSGYVFGWTPSIEDIGQTFTVTIRATNNLGSDDESWNVNVSGCSQDWVFEDCLTNNSKISGSWGTGTFSASGYTLSHSGGYCCETGTARSVDYVWYDLPKSSYGGSWAQGTIEFDLVGLYPGIGLDKTELFAACDSTGLNPATTMGEFYDSPYYTIFRKANDNYGNQDKMKSTVKGGNGTIEQWSNVWSWSGTTVYRFRYTWNGTDARWYRGLPGQVLTEISPPSPFNVGAWSPNILHIQLGSTFRAGPRNICSCGGYPGTVYKLLRVYNVDKGNVATPADCPGCESDPVAPDITEVSPDPDWAMVGSEYVRQLSLAQGTPSITWSVIDGPAGTQVDSTGRVHGWTPTPAQAAQAFTLTVRATNSAGSDDESWLVQVISPPTDTIAGFPFNSGAEGWTLQTWRSSTQYDPGYEIWDAAGGNPGGNLKAGGNGTTNNADSCTREGGLATRQISTAGFTNIQIEYDVMAALNSPPAAGCDGGCVADVLEGSCEDKLVVYYSTSGTGGPWVQAEQLNEGADLPATWTHKVISLAAVPAANDNPGFAVQFKWQFNTATDAGRIDNVIIKGSLLGNNEAPQVDAGEDQTVTFPNGANLDGTVSDDGLPDPPGEVIATWSKQSGPGTVTFGDVNATQTTASFGTAGIYVLKLLATDSQLTGEDLVTITVNESTPADFDGDGDVDQTDFGIFQACLSGTGQTPEPGCEKADLNGDGDVDQPDFAQFYGCLGGPDQPPGC